MGTHWTWTEDGFVADNGAETVLAETSPALSSDIDRIWVAAFSDGTEARHVEHFGWAPLVLTPIAHDLPARTRLRATLVAVAGAVAAVGVVQLLHLL